eukprot:NODE_3937_length_860_cov_6.004932_g3267_i0.p6 GENE.NODE_3937_length_860_cov_6.004932_g3267_i0~~NODE_3937_length_860_cov_6.004932_g3267_i0.p6  ORF type:complete len:64 (-),score=0.50 NODE_3937_length_860_cov_6.004932_g3267_i0:348-539(-)
MGAPKKDASQTSSSETSKRRVSTRLLDVSDEACEPSARVMAGHGGPAVLAGFACSVATHVCML